MLTKFLFHYITCHYKTCFQCIVLLFSFKIINSNCIVVMASNDWNRRAIWLVFWMWLNLSQPKIYIIRKCTLWSVFMQYIIHKGKIHRFEESHGFQYIINNCDSQLHATGAFSTVSVFEICNLTVSSINNTSCKRWLVLISCLWSYLSCIK